MTDSSWLDEISLAVADGSDPIAPPKAGEDSDAARAAAQLLELATLRSVFRSRAAGADADEPICPFTWGRLEVQEVIGEGSFARVYRAHDPVLDRDVALKLFRHDRGDLDAAQLIAEARRHARVHHPRVLAVHGAEIDGEVAGLWTDLLTGRTLADAIKADGPMDQASLHALASDLASGLAAVHEQGMVHGDLKPANVWLDQRGRAILMDFGAASPADAESPARFGSPVTMAPELFAKSPPSPASDAYALGAVVHFAATSRYPVPGDTLADIQRAHEAGVTIATGALPKELRPLLLALLSPSRASRPSVPAVLSELDELATAPQRRFRRRALAALVITLVAGLGTSLYLLQRSETARDAAEAARQAAEQAQFDAQTSKNFLIESVRRMSPEAERGLGTVKAVLDFLSEFGDDRLAKTPLALGELKVVVGTRLTHFEEVERGVALAREGIALIELSSPKSHHELARAYNALAETERQLSRYDDALEDVTVALSHLAQVEATDETRYQIVQMRGLLVGLYGDLGEWGKGLEAQRQQLADRAALVGEDDPRMAVEYNNLGQSLLTVGNYAEALEAFEQAMALLEAGETPRPFPEALVNEAIASTLMRLRRAEEASRELENTRERFLALGIEPTDDRFKRLRRLEAGILRREGNNADALAIYADLVAQGGMQPYTERATRIFHAVVLLALERPGDALPELRLAREAYAWDEGHPERRYLDAAIAFADAWADGEPPRSRPVVEETLTFYTTSGYGGTDLADDLTAWLAVAGGEP